MHTEPMLKAGALADKVIIVTGGGTGLGRSMTQYFLELGARAVIARPRRGVFAGFNWLLRLLISIQFFIFKYIRQLLNLSL